MIKKIDVQNDRPLRKSEAFRLVARMLADEKILTSKDLTGVVMRDITAEINALADHAQREEGPGVALPVVLEIAEIKVEKEIARPKKIAR